MAATPSKTAILREIKVQAVMEGFDLSHKQLSNLNKSISDTFNALPKHRQNMANLEAIVNNAFTDMAKNAKKAADAIDKISSGFARLNNAALSGVKSILDLGFKFTGITAAMKSGLEAVEGYNNSLLSVSGSFKKYGMGVTETEARVKGLGKTLNMTQGDVLKFFSAYEKGFRSFSAGGFEKMMVNIRNSVGLATDAQQEMLGSLSQLSAKIPELQGAIERLDTTDRKRLNTMTQIMLVSGKMSLQEYKASQTYIQSSLVISAADRKRQAELKKNQESFAKLKMAAEKFMLAVGKALMPIMEKFADSIDKIVPEVEAFFNKMKGWVEGAVKNWEQLKNIIVAIGIAAGAIKLGAMAMKFGKGAIGLAGALGAGMGWGGGPGAAGAAARGGLFTPFTSRWNNASNATGLRGKAGALFATGLTRGEKFNRGFTGAMTYGVGHGLGEMSENMKTSAIESGSIGAERGAAGVGLGASALKIGGLAQAGSAFGPWGAAIGATIGAFTELGNIVSNVGSLFESTATKMARAAKTREKDEEEALRFKQGSIEEYKKNQTSIISKNIDDKRRADEMEAARQYGKDALKDPTKRKELEMQAEALAVGVENAGKEFKDFMESRTTTAQLSKGDTRTYTGEQRVENINKDIGGLSMDLATAQEQGASKGVLANLQSDIDILKTKLKEAEEDADKISETFTYGGKSLEEWNISAAKVSASLQEISTAEFEIVKRAQQQKAVTESITGSLLEQSEVAAMMGRVIEEDLVAGYKQVTAEMDKELGFLNERLTILQKQEAAADGEMRITEEFRNLQANIANTTKEINSLTTRKISLAAQLGDKYKYQLALAEKQTSLFTQMVSLADNFAIGVGASADMRMMAVQSMEKEIELLEKEKNWRINIAALAEKNGKAEEDVLPLRQAVLETEGKILQKKIQQAEQTKVLRDGWISAMGAMNTGAGRFTKILVTQQQNLQSALKMGGVVSSMSGALQGGYTQGAQFSAQAPGVINPEQGGVGGGAFAYNTTIPQAGAFGIQNLLRNRTVADATAYSNNALDQANANANRGRYEGMAAIDQPYNLSAMQQGAGQRQNARTGGFVPPNRRTGSDWRSGGNFANGGQSYYSGVGGMDFNVETGNTRDLKTLPIPSGRSAWPTVGPSGAPVPAAAAAAAAAPAAPAAPVGISVPLPKLESAIASSFEQRLQALDIKAKGGGYDTASREALSKEIDEFQTARNLSTDESTKSSLDKMIQEKTGILKQKNTQYYQEDEYGLSRTALQSGMAYARGETYGSKDWKQERFKTSGEATRAIEFGQERLSNTNIDLAASLKAREEEKRFKESGPARLEELKKLRDARVKESNINIDSHGANSLLVGGGLAGYMLDKGKGKSYFGDLTGDQRANDQRAAAMDVERYSNEINALQKEQKRISENVANTAAPDELVRIIGPLNERLQSLIEVRDKLSEKENAAALDVIDKWEYGANLVKDALQFGAEKVNDKMTDFVTDPSKEGRTPVIDKKAEKQADYERMMERMHGSKTIDPETQRIMDNQKKTRDIDPETQKIIDNQKKPREIDPAVRDMMERAGVLPKPSLKDVVPGQSESGSFDPGQGQGSMKFIPTVDEEGSGIPRLAKGGTIKETGLAVVHEGETVVPAGGKSGTQLSIGQIIVNLEAGELDMLPTLIANAINSKLSSNPAARSIYSGGRSEAGGMVNGGGRTFINSP